jgi:DNA repair exonuclease SbcCD ATPase subunit
MRSEIESLDDTLKTAEAEGSLAPLRARLKALTTLHDQKEAELDRKRSELNDAELERMRSASGLAALQEEYSEVFTKHFHSRERIEFHPSIKTSLAESTCAICGSKGAAVVKSIENKMQRGKCPLCESTIAETPSNSEGLELLRVVDQQISEMKKRLEVATKTKARLLEELKRNDADLAVTRAEINKLTSENEGLKSRPPQGSAELGTLREAKVEQMEDLLRKSREQYEERNLRQIELLQLYDELRQKYDEAKTEFVPLFRSLAGLFIGMDMDIHMEYSTSISTAGPQLVVEMEGQARRQMYQLSESQRFFLDIALRMALTNYMSDPDGRACLFIDTPEGSLDIAYESRAGQMFAEFVENGHDIMMTANINSSQILRKMASVCGKSKMVLYRMMPWAELSSVQQEEEPLFREAYETIEAELEKGGTPDG